MECNPITTVARPIQTNVIDRQESFHFKVSLKLVILVEEDRCLRRLLRALSKAFRSKMISESESSDNEPAVIVFKTARRRLSILADILCGLSRVEFKTKTRETGTLLDKTLTAKSCENLRFTICFMTHEIVLWDVR